MSLDLSAKIPFGSFVPLSQEEEFVVSHCAIIVVFGVKDKPKNLNMIPIIHFTDKVN